MKALNASVPGSTQIRRLLLLFLPVLLCVTCEGSHSGLSSGDTNVVLIMIDTLRADHMGCYGYHRDTTPRIDGIARTSIVFDRCIAQSPWTRPSVASILTSTYPFTHGIEKERTDGLPDGLLTLGEFLSDHGYDTRGYTANPNINTVFGFGRGFDSYVDSDAVFDWMLGIESSPESAPTGLEYFFDAEKLTGIVLGDLGDFDQPFYLQVLFMDPHYPYTPPASYSNRFGRSEVDLYDGEIAFTDEFTGILIDSIGARWPNTLFIITSDHGEGLGENNDSRLDERHGNFLYDTIVRVPLIFSHPSLQERRVPETMEHIDVFPTVAQLLGLPVPEGVEGISFASELRSGGRLDKRNAYFETGWRNMKKAGLTSGKWKYIINFDYETMNHINRRDGRGEYFLPEELHDLSLQGPERTENNLATNRPELVDSLRSSMEHILKARSGRSGRKTIDRLDRQTEAQLKALGYLEGENR